VVLLKRRGCTGAIKAVGVLARRASVWDVVLNVVRSMVLGLGLFGRVLGGTDEEGNEAQRAGAGRDNRTGNARDHVRPLHPPSCE